MKKGIVIIIGLSVVILLVSGFMLGRMSQGSNILKKEIFKTDDKEIGLLESIKSGKSDPVDYGKENNKKYEEHDCPTGWQFYRQDVIGVEFCYPEEKWGKVKLEPVEPITNLNKLLENEHYYQDSSKDSNGSYNILEVVFEKSSAPNKHSSPTIKLMRNNAPINKCDDSNVMGSRLGCNENVIPLRKYQDICKYSINYEKQGTLRKSLEGEGLRELYNECDNGLKITLSELSDYFNFKDPDTKELVGWRYQYFLDMFAYKKLQNGYFDDALIFYDVDSISQIKNKINGWQDFFNFDHSYKNDKRITLSQEEFRRKKADFQKFIKSIKVFKPVKEDLLKYKANISGQDTNMKLIGEYYWLLTNKKLNDAYQLKLTNQTFDDFKKQYENIHYAKPYDILDLGNGSYEFYVEYQDENKPVEIYQVKVKMNKHKIQTLFIQRFVGEVAKFGNMKAYAGIRGEKAYVILEKDNREIVVDQGFANYDFENKSNNRALTEVKFFNDVKFSPKGNYLLYKEGGWEWCLAHVYDINAEREVFEADSCSPFDFTDDEKYFYHCASSGMGGYRAGRVLVVPGFKEVFNVFGELNGPEKYSQNNEYEGVECEYQKDKGEIVFKLTNYDNKFPEKILKYQLHQVGL